VSGKQAKRQRREQGTSIAMRRDHHAFQREIARVVAERDVRRARARRTRRQVFAWSALAVIVASIVAGLAL
jgi:hypothetical protein